MPQRYRSGVPSNRIHSPNLSRVPSNRDHYPCQALAALAVTLIFIAFIFLLINAKISINLKCIQSQYSDIYPEIFHQPEAFKRNYAEMEREFKVFVYPDGDPNTYYHTPFKLLGKYASEGYFFKNIKESRFWTNDPGRAHMFFIPISCHKMVGKGVSDGEIRTIVKHYVQGLISKYPYWNKTQGADHFFVTCHDIDVKATEGVSLLMKNSIRVVCSSEYGSGYIPGRDVSLPQVVQPFALEPVTVGIEDRTILAFWTDYRSSEIRKFYQSKFCISPADSHVNRISISDAIHYGCVPVILSDNYDLPFNNILQWDQFSVIVKRDYISELNDILTAISNKGHFIELQTNTVKAQKHFQWNSPPIKYDAFHMVMYELWLRRRVSSPLLLEYDFLL